MRILRSVMICLAAISAAPAGAAAETVPDQVVVQFETGADRGAVRRSADVGVVRALRRSGQQLLTVRPGQSVAEAVRALEADPRVRYAEPNAVYRAAAVPNDPLFAQLWALNTIGAPAAWGLTAGRPGVLVAIADSGVAYDHPDLVGNIWSPRGYDFVGAGDGDPYDVNGHGTHVAGTLGAVGNNGIGIAGVNWNVSMLAVRVLNASGWGTAADIAEGLDYAGDMGARVVSAAFADSQGSKAIEDAILSHPNTLYVAAAGNEGTSNEARPRYPCNYEALNLICVAATTPADGLAPGSNTGTTSVDLGAPGTSILSTAPHKTASAPAGWNAVGWQVDGTRLSTGAYGPMSNTSVTTAGALSGSSRGCTLTFSLDLDTQPDGDFLYLETSPDNAHWTERGSWSGTFSGVVKTGIDADAAGANLWLRFRLRSDGTIFGDGATIDDVSAECVNGTPGSTLDYADLSGSSMAAAHVAGAAALILAWSPTTTLSDLRDMLLSSGKPLPALAGRTVTGRRLDARAAMASPPSRVPTTLRASGVAAKAATFNGRLNPAGTAANYQFQYGLTRAYNQVAPGAPTFAGAGVGSQTVSETVGGLVPGTTYHYRVVAVRGGERLFGRDRTFTAGGGRPRTLRDVKVRRCRQSGRGRRTRLRCTLARADALARATLRLKRGKKTVALATVKPNRSARTLTLKLTRKLRRGRYVLTLTLRGAAGERRTLRYRFRIR